jgi:hypothetical protein
MSSVTLAVSDVAPAERRFAPLVVADSVQSLLERKVEAMALSDKRLVSCKDVHPFVQAAHDAFFLHYPLVISPDDVWFCIAQGFAQHVNLHAEKLRHHFVSHSGKKKLIVERVDFELGRSNPWPEVFTSFSEQIAEQVGTALRDVIVCDFSTSTHFHRAACEVAMMDAFQPYFEYEMLIGCGIPAITLTGAPDDWRDVRRRALSLAQYGLEDWIAALVPILDELEATSRGQGNAEFWKSFFRYNSGSLGAAITGWIHVLFPYLKSLGKKSDELVANPYLKTWKKEWLRITDIEKTRQPVVFMDKIEGPCLPEIPAGVASAPVVVENVRTLEKHEMRFVAGMFGVAQDEQTKSLSCSFGWAVVYDTPLPRKRRTYREIADKKRAQGN